MLGTGFSSRRRCRFVQAERIKGTHTKIMGDGASLRRLTVLSVDWASTSAPVLQGRPMDANTASDPLRPRWPSLPSREDVPAKVLGAEACVLRFAAADDSKVGGDENTGKVLGYKM